jgi:hypothetical protein
MAVTKDTEVMLNALRKERDELHNRLLQLDRIIKRVRLGQYKNDEETGISVTTETNPQINKASIPLSEFPKNADIKVQILRVFDVHRKAAKLKELQSIYNKLSDSHYNIREPLRSLHRSRVVRMIREKDHKPGT